MYDVVFVSDQLIWIEQVKYNKKNTHTYRLDDMYVQQLGFHILAHAVEIRLRQHHGYTVFDGSCFPDEMTARHHYGY